MLSAFEVSMPDGFYFYEASRNRLRWINIIMASFSGLILLFWLLTKYRMNMRMERELWINNYR